MNFRGTAHVRKLKRSAVANSWQHVTHHHTQEFHLPGHAPNLEFDDQRPTNNHQRQLHPSRHPHNTAIMGRMHSNGKGIAASAVPYSRQPPAWLKTTPDQVVDQICKLAKKGATPSQIGVVLRDSHGVAQVKVVTGTDIPTRTATGRIAY